MIPLAHSYKSHFKNLTMDCLRTQLASLQIEYLR
jgi:hypothetical protein